MPFPQNFASAVHHQVGSSASECDTIPGRQCMASCFFLLKQFEDVLIYLKSIKSYFTAGLRILCLCVTPLGVSKLFGGNPGFPCLGLMTTQSSMSRADSRSC